MMRIRYRPTTLALALFCSLALVCGYAGVTLLSQSGPAGCQTPPPASNWVCVNGVWVPPSSPPTPTPTPPPPPVRVITVGEEITGTLTSQVAEMLFELTAPSDGTLVVELSGAYLQLEGVYWQPMWRPPNIYSTIATLQVAAGQTYHLSVWTYFSYYYYYYEEAPFVLRTSLASGPVTIPPGCETDPPVSGWICISGGGWVPPDHPLALTGSPSPPPPPAPPPPGPVGCSSIQPVATWVCVNGGWLPPDHPLAQSGSNNPPPPAPPPVPPPGCTTPDPFVGIPGLVGVCVDGNWVPSGHPQAPPNPIANYTGTYTLTVTTESSGPYCPAGTPQELRQRDYTATVEQTGADLKVTLTGADFVIALDGSGNSFPGRVSSTGEIWFSIKPAAVWDYDGPDVVERLSDGTAICVAGTIAATGTPTGIVGTVSASHGGTIYRCSGNYIIHNGCWIERLEMVRR